MTRSWVRAAWLCASLLVGLAGGGCKCDRGKAKKIIDKYMGFSEQGKPDAGIRFAYTIRTRDEAFKNGRSRAVAHIEVAPDTDNRELRRILALACHDEHLLRAVSAVRVVAWPGKLRSLVAPVGESVFARDGHGWEGAGISYETIEVHLPTDEQLKARGLAPLTETEYLRALGVDNMLQRGTALDEAVNRTAARHGVAAQTIQAAVDKAQRIFGKPGGDRD